MARLRWALVALSAALAAGTWVEYARVAASPVRAVARYHCPMHPAIVAERPGACPICGMDLARIHADDRTARPSGVPGLVPVDLTPERIQLIGLRTAPVARAEIAPTLRTVGFVTADEGGIAIVAARFSGWIERLLVPRSGSPVKRGQRLAAIYSPELIAAQQIYLNAVRWESESTAAKGASVIERDARARLQLTGMSEEDIDELARRRQPMRLLHVRSPIDGYVGKKAALAGAYVQPGAELFEIADLSTLWVIADVHASEIGRVQVGQAARISVPGGSGPELDGTVSFVYPAVSTGSRTVQVRLAVRNPGLRLRPGMFANVMLSARAVHGLVVPSEAIVDTGQIQYAFVKSGGGRLEPRQVRLGVRSGGKVHVLEGVAEGEEVVTTANFLVDSESRLRAALEGFGAPLPASRDETRAPGRDDHERREAPAHEAGEHGTGATTEEDPPPASFDGT